MARFIVEALVVATLASGAVARCQAGDLAGRVPSAVAGEAVQATSPVPTGGPATFKLSSIETLRIPDVVPKSHEDEAVRPGSPRPFTWIKGSREPAEAQQRLEQQLNDPEQRRALERDMLAGLREFLPDLGIALGLADAGVERFLGLLVEGNLREAQRGTAPTRSGATSFIASPETEATLASAFGPAVMARWRDYQHTIGARMRVRGLEMTMDRAGVPLSTEQRQRVIESYRRASFELAGRAAGAGGAPAASQSSEPSAAGRRQGEAPLRSLKLVEALNDRVLMEARGFLTAEQQSVLERALRSQLDRQRQSLERSEASRRDPAPAH